MLREKLIHEAGVLHLGSWNILLIWTFLLREGACWKVAVDRGRGRVGRSDIRRKSGNRGRLDLSRRAGHWRSSVVGMRAEIVVNPNSRDG